jgi:hypothetical protein
LASFNDDVKIPAGRCLLGGWGLALVTAAALVLPAAAQETKPNVVFILADNVGYGEMGPYGGGELRGFMRRQGPSEPALREPHSVPGAHR